MSIETVGSSANLIKNNNAESWVKKNDLEVNKMLDYSDLKTGVNSYQDNSKTKNIHETLLMVEKADIAFKAMNQMRLKVLDAYKEVMRMQV